MDTPLASERRLWTSAFPRSSLQTYRDIGCSGGGFVRMCLDDGHAAIGLEGSDYSKRNHRAEWKMIPANLFTCDATHRFDIRQLGPDSGEARPARFDVITSWEFIEHIRAEDLPMVCENVARG